MRYNEVILVFTVFKRQISWSSGFFYLSFDLAVLIMYNSSCDYSVYVLNFLYLFAV